jgi:ATP adenylyltransferase
MLNIYPYNNGHLMISPKRHVRDLTQLKEAEMLDFIKALNKAKKLLDKVLKPDGYNIGANLGRAAGAGITGHLHLHIVPRWVGDTNFMSVTGSTKVISQSLKDLYKLLRDAQSKTN